MRLNSVLFSGNNVNTLLDLCLTTTIQVPYITIFWLLVTECLHKGNVTKISFKQQYSVFFKLQY